MFKSTKRNSVRLAAEDGGIDDRATDEQLQHLMEETHDQSSPSPTLPLTTDELEELQLKVLARSFGDWGFWQAFWCFVLSLYQACSTFHIFTFVFQTIEKEFWCARPSELSNVDIAIWRNLTQPQDACTILNATFTELMTLANNGIASFLNANLTTTKCTEFQFAADPVAPDAVTLIEDFALVCTKRNLLSVVEMCFLAGAAVGSVSSGWISDRYGRKHTLMGCALVQTVFGTILAFSTSLAMFMTLRVIMGFASMTVTVVSFVLVVELVSGKWRIIVGILNILPVALTYILTAGIAYYIRDWRTLQLTITLPWLALLSIWYCMPESPRWLLARGRLEELYILVERAAHMNRRILPSTYKKSLEAAAPSKTINTYQTPTTQTPSEPNRESTDGTTMKNIVQEEVVDYNTNPLKVVFGKKYWRITCLNLVVWLTLIIIYFGLTLHLSNLGGNIYWNTIIAGSVEAVSICVSVFIVLKLGIRRNLIAFMVIPGICCLATNLVPPGDGNLMGVIGLAMISKCFIGANNAIIPTYTAMQYPTMVRNFGVGMGNLAAGIALILVPYMWLLEHVEPLLPMSIMGVCGIIGAIALAMMKDIRN